MSNNKDLNGRSGEVHWRKAPRRQPLTSEGHLSARDVPEVQSTNGLINGCQSHQGQRQTDVGSSFH